MKKKLLVFTSTFPRWKNDTNPPFVYELSKRLVSYFDVYVIAPHYHEAKKYEIMDGMKVYRFRYFFEKWQKLAGTHGMLPTLKRKPIYYCQIPFFLISEYIALRSLIKKIKPDIIHAHWIIPQGFIASLASKVPFVVTTHGGDIFGLQGKIPTQIKKFTLRRATKITVVSNAIKHEIYKKIDSKLKVNVIPMGVDTSLFNPNKYDHRIKEKYGIDGPFLLFVGRLSEKKGAEYLIKSLPQIAKEFPKTKLLIVGSGELEKDLKNLAAELYMEKNVIFSGPISNNNLPNYYATADIFIAPSIIAKGGDREGMPVTLMEAASSGCITIATNLPGNKDIITHKKNGFLVNQKNEKEISNTVLTLLKKKSLFKFMKNESRKQAMEKFDWNLIKKSYYEVLLCD